MRYISQRIERVIVLLDWLFRRISRSVARCDISVLPHLGDRQSPARILIARGCPLATQCEEPRRRLDLRSDLSWALLHGHLAAQQTQVDQLGVELGYRLWILGVAVPDCDPILARQPDNGRNDLALQAGA